MSGGVGSGGPASQDFPPWPRGSPPPQVHATDPPGRCEYPGARNIRSCRVKPISHYQAQPSVSPGLQHRHLHPGLGQTGQTRGLHAHNLHVLNVQDGDRSHPAAGYQRSRPVKTLYQA